jgi:hypothetical protein
MDHLYSGGTIQIRIELEKGKLAESQTDIGDDWILHVKLYRKIVRML